MATTSNTYTGNGTNKLFSITFPYLDTADINVYLNGTLQTVTTQYTFANATTVEFVAAPANGATVLLDRSTDDTTLAATFFPGSSIKAADLNENFDQVLYIAQETINSAANQSTAGLQAQITAATNTANTAITTANAADATANGIAGTANTALSNSSSAVTTANAASVTATNAETTANAISTTANTALSTANAALPKAGGTMTGSISFVAGQTFPGTSGKLIQTVTTSTGAVATGTTTIPLDDTIPQNTEGNEYMTRSITPTSSSSLLCIQATANLSSTAGTSNLSVALFQDSTANALAVVTKFMSNGNLNTLNLTYWMTAGTTSATTFKIRAGSSAAGTTTLNGVSSARLFGGVCFSNLSVMELTP
jgi:hypothetical protein